MSDEITVAAIDHAIDRFTRAEKRVQDLSARLSDVVSDDEIVIARLAHAASTAAADGCIAAEMTLRPPSSRDASVS